ncbi:choline/ethanolamine kinase family protein [Veillonella sp. VA137]|uniref:choline/ethanolamine kinase family protein n=1 Tax=Veillonella sp. VA137 TaxID=741828 RepID=UPI0013DF4CA7|nr:choline/ethanolamine kinase family protein [Veillonella sp. VA137]
MIPCHNIHIKNDNILDREKITIFLSKILKVHIDDIVSLEPVKKGLTNDSFTFSIKNDGKYVIRIPNTNTSTLVNREEETAVYSVIQGLHISDEILYLDPASGIKITKFVNQAHSLDVYNQDELSLALDKLKELHHSGLEVQHTFDLRRTIDKYELLRGNPSLFQNYEFTRTKMLELLACIDTMNREYCLCHIDANCDNFLITDTKEVRLIDFEYAGMQDPNLDIAMICLYSQLDRKMIDVIIDTYYDEKIDDATRYLIYAYIAIGGFIWSIWCEVKEGTHVLENKYARSQYDYAMKYFQIVYEQARELNMFKGLYS